MSDHAPEVFTGLPEQTQRLPRPRRPADHHAGTATDPARQRLIKSGASNRAIAAAMMRSAPDAGVAQETPEGGVPPGGLPARAPGADGAELLRMALGGDARGVAAILDRLGDDEQRALLLELTSAAGPAGLDGLAASPAGSALLGRAYASITPASGTAERGLTAQILAAKAARQGAGPVTRVFPFMLRDDRPDRNMGRDYGTLKHHTDLSVERQAGGLLRIRYAEQTRAAGRFGPDLDTLGPEVFGDGLYVDENELVGVRLHDEGGEVVVRPALLLLELAQRGSAQRFHEHMQVLELGGLVLGGSALEVTRGLSMAKMLAQYLELAGEVADLLAVLVGGVLDHQDEIVRRLGPEEGADVVTALKDVRAVLDLGAFGLPVLATVPADLDRIVAALRRLPGAWQRAGERLGEWAAWLGRPDYRALERRLDAEDAVPPRAPDIAGPDPGPAKAEAFLHDDPAEALGLVKDENQRGIASSSTEGVERLIDRFGDGWIFKPARFEEPVSHRAIDREIAVNEMAYAYGFDTAQTRAITWGGRKGMLQRDLGMRRHLNPDERFESWTQPMLDDIAREHVLDWALDNADSHDENWAVVRDKSFDGVADLLPTAGNQVIGIDKGRSLLDPERLHARSPMAAPMMYYDLFQKIEKRGLPRAAVDRMYAAAVLAAQRIRATDDGIISALARSMYPHRPGEQPPIGLEYLVSGVLRRKNGVVDDVEKFWEGVYSRAGWPRPER